MTMKDKPSKAAPRPRSHAGARRRGAITVDAAGLIDALPQGAAITGADGAVLAVNAALRAQAPELAEALLRGDPGARAAALARNLASSSKTITGGRILHLFDRPHLDSEAAASALLAEVIDVLPDGFAVWGEDDRLLCANGPMRELASRSDTGVDGVRTMFQPHELYGDFLRRRQAQGRLPHAAAGREEQWIDDRVTERRGNPPAVLQRGRDGSFVEFREVCTRSGAVVAWRRDVTDLRLTQEALEETTDRLLSIIDAGPMMVVITNREHRILEANHTFAAMMGSTPHQLRNRDLRLVLDAATADELVEQHDRVMATGMVAQCEEFYSSQMPGQLGVRGWLVTKIPLYNRNMPDEPTGIASVGVEITERMIAMRKIREKEANWRRMLDMLPDAVFSVNKLGMIMFANAPAAALAEKSKDDLAGGRLSNFLMPPEREAMRERLLALFEQDFDEDSGDLGAWQPDGCMFYSSAGNPVVCEMMLVPVLDDGHIVSALVVIRDVRDRAALEYERRQRQMQLEETLTARTAAARTAAEQFDAAVRASPDAFAVIDRFGRLAFVSDRLLQYYPGLDRVVTVGLPLAEIVDTVAASRPRGTLGPIGEWWRRAEGMIECAAPGAKKEGGKAIGRRWVRLSAARGADGQVVIVQTDITDYKRQQLRLRLDAKRLERALESQRNLVSMVSHELRSPLAVIDSSAQIVTRHFDRLQKEEILGRMGDTREQVSRMVTMVDSILTTARLEDGHLMMKWDRVQIVDLVQSTVEELASIHAGRPIEGNYGMACDVAGDLNLLRLVVVNLLSNAMKYSPAGTPVAVKVQVEPDIVEISVSDQGVGIPKLEISRIFDRYYRASTAFTQRGASGTGIGLSVVKEIVEIHHGEVRVDSVVGAGSTFTVILPRQPDLAGYGNATESGSGGEHKAMVC